MYIAGKPEIMQLMYILCIINYDTVKFPTNILYQVYFSLLSNK